ncbi:MAG: methyl-accepting chemotaxis protein [Treponema sp.]|nr:methyl-accepting chemotaxis protein [Treponema sp.]
MSLKNQIRLWMLGIIILASVLLVVLSYTVSKKELDNAVKLESLNLAHATASEIYNVNDREYKMLEALANLSSIRDPNVDLHDKWRLINTATGGAPQYLGMAIYDDKGVGWTTTEKYSDLHEREYLRIALTGRRSLMDPNWSPVNGNLSTFYALPFYDNNGKQEGVVVSVLDSTELCRTVAGITFGKESHPYVVNRVTGAFVAHEVQDNVNEGKLISDDASPEFLPIIERIQAGDTDTASYKDSATGIKYSVAFRPVEGCDWTVVCIAPYSDFYSGLEGMLRVMIITCIITIIVAFILSSIVISLSINPLKKVSNSIHTIASGNADLTKRLDEKATSEINELVDGFNHFTEKLQTIVGDLKISKEQLKKADSMLDGTVQENTETVGEMLSKIEEMGSILSVQNNSVDSTAGTVSQIAQSITGLRQMIQDQSKSVDVAATAVTQMIGNIGSVNSSIEKLANEYKVLTENVQNGTTHHHQVSELVAEIQNKSKMLNEANSVISSIAEQTNLLAMNAAIEAAHAGEAGKGFSVVADEIRKLSETSSSQSKNIGTQLHGIQESIQAVVQASSQADHDFGLVSEKLQHTGILVQEIRGSMDEQSSGSKQIGDALAVMNDSSDQVRYASDEMDRGSQTIVKEVDSLKQVSSSILEIVQAMGGTVNRIKKSDESLLHITGDMNQSIDRIGKQIDEFQV